MILIASPHRNIFRLVNTSDFSLFFEINKLLIFKIREIYRIHELIRGIL